MLATYAQILTVCSAFFFPTALAIQKCLAADVNDAVVAQPMTEAPVSSVGPVKPQSPSPPQDRTRLESIFQGKRFIRKPTPEAENAEITIVKYRLFVPEDAVADRGKKWPLLVWMHGYLEAGDDNRLNLRWLELLFTQYPDRPKFPCFVVASQCPKDHSHWTGGPSENEPLTLLKSIVEELIAEYPIDTRRIYVSGVSSGGNGVWEMLARYPELAAAGAPLASSGSQSRNLESIAQIPIWALHVRDDPDVSIDADRKTVRRLTEIGAKVYFTETPGTTHDCWTMAFRDLGLMSWLLAQTKGVDGPAPQYSTFAVNVGLWKQTLTSSRPQYYLVLPTIIIAGWWFFKRQMRRRRLERAMAFLEANNWKS